METGSDLNRKELPQVLLASASPRRKRLLSDLGLSFDVLASSIEELRHEQLTARELSLVNSYRKARSVAKEHPDCLVIGADTLVHLDNVVFGKPVDLAEARLILEQLQGQTHQVVTGVCLLHLRSHRQTHFAETTFVTFKQLGLKAIDDYLSKIDPLDKAGAYALQEHGDILIEDVVGSVSNVVGLPLERLKEELENW